LAVADKMADEVGGMIGPDNGVGMYGNQVPFLLVL